MVGLPYFLQDIWHFVKAKTSNLPKVDPYWIIMPLVIAFVGYLIFSWITSLPTCTPETRDNTACIDRS